MNKGFTIHNRINEGDLYIVVSNYEFDNEVYNWGFSKIELDFDISENDIGYWKI